MKRIFTAIFIVLASVTAFSQQSTTQNQVPEAQKRLDALKGTYELKKVSRLMVALPTNLAEIIETNRKESEVNTIMLNHGVQLIIYPRNQIAPISRDGK